MNKQRSLGVKTLILVAFMLLAGISRSVPAQDTNRFQGTGNAGINTTSPPNPLTIVRSGSSPYTVRPDYELLQLVDKTDNTPQLMFGSYYNAMALRYTATSSTSASQRLGIFTGGLTEAFVVNNDGNVGIGTTNPADKLSIESSNPSAFIGAYVKNTAGDASGTLTRFSVGQTNSETAALLFQFDHSSHTATILNRKTSMGILELQTTGGGITIRNSGNVGIGTTSPSAKLDVNGNIAIASGGLIATNGPAGSAISIYGSLADAYGKQLTIKDGSVGIGNTNPQFKLDVNGTINSNSTITANNIVAKYQDVAEWVPSSEQLAAGTVVVLDSTKSNQVIASTVGYDTRVAGVISAQPGIALGEKGEGKVLVATTGRVKIKVDASKSPIQIGDLLVTSDVPGVAMKSEAVAFGGVQFHRPGTLIGKALEPLDRGKGEILVLLSLQ